MTRLSVVMLCAALLVSGAAAAQKSKDTVRIPVGEPISGLSDYLNPNPENEFYSAAVHDTLIAFDEDQNKFVPLLAKAWTRIDDRTTEFELRDDVKWHDGEALDADDVVHTLEWLIHPEVKLRNKRNYEWIERVEKVGPHTVRVTARKPTPYDEAQLSNNIYMLPEHLHAKLPLTDKLAFARKPVGTGMFRAVEVSDAKGIFLVKSDAYRHGGTAKPAGNIRNMNLPFMPDYGGRIAEFLAGNVDMLARQLTIDQMEDLAKQPNVKASLVQGASIAYMAIDARGRAGVQALTDVRVRRAMFMAIDRPALAKLVAGDHPLNRTPEALCWKDQMGCDYTLLPPAHDPAAAKKLLAEAGYPSGFDIEISTYTTTVADFAVGISGQLAKIGIRATVQKHTIAAHRKVESEGKIAVMVGGYPTGSTPDTSNVLAFFFDPPPSSDYHADAELHGLVKQMDGLMDPVKRRELGRQVFDRATEQAYFMVVGPRPVQMVYRDYLDVKPSRYANVGFQPGGVNWK